MRRINQAVAGILVLGCSFGCSSGPSKGNVKEQLEQHEVFAKPEIWHICLGTQTKEGEARCMSGFDPKARDLGLTKFSGLQVEPMLHDGAVSWVPSDKVQTAIANGGIVVVAMVGPDGTRGWIPRRNVRAAEKDGGMIADQDDGDRPVVTITLTDKGRQFLQEPGSILKDDEAAFVIARREILKVTRITRLGPDSMVAEFQWRAVPTDAGNLFSPTRGLSVRTAKALFRLDEHKRWKLMDPHGWESGDPRAKEFDLYEQTLEK